MVNSRQKEIDEAISAVDTTLEHLLKAQSYLGSASSWGLFDMFGGGFITTMIKHGKMDEAKKAMLAARNSIQSLKKELSDVDKVIEVDLEIDSFLNLADYFFDGIIAD